MSGFQKALDLLHSQIATDAASINSAAARRCDTVPEIREYMARIGLPYQNDDITTSGAFKSVIHVTGTKGKGSTCSMIESVLRRSHGQHTGMFTSPHLVKVTERIRLDGQPISEVEFAAAYMQVRKLLLECPPPENSINGNGIALSLLPGYFRMMTLVALFVFQHHRFPDGKGMDVTILEVGMGGRYDATNVFATSDVVGITLLDLDHTRVLGDTLEKIAWEKGGIIKRPSQSNNAERDSECVFVSSENTPGVLKVLGRCATEVGSPITVVHTGDYVKDDWVVGLAGEHQRRNADVALAVCQSWASNRATGTINDKSSISAKDAIAATSWPGRCHTIDLMNGRIHLRCDGAHTEKSIASCIKWFRSVSHFDNSSKPEQGSTRILVFNCSHERSPVALLSLFCQASKQTNRPLFDEVHFCPSKAERPSAVLKASASRILQDAGISTTPAEDAQQIDRSWQETLAKVWSVLEKISECPTTNGQVYTHSNMSDCLNSLQTTVYAKSSHVEVLVTGSLLLVGSVLEEIGWSETPAYGQLGL
jgi:folylpolyglutamate synthase